MAKQPISKEFRKRLDAVTGKRARIVVDHVLEHGYITTEELKEKYGYHHPPRARRDVVDQGIPIETFYVKGSSGAKIGAYRFGDPKKMRAATQAGRRVLPKKFKDQLTEQYGVKCGICSGSFEPRYLQMDHRIPYEVSGDDDGELDVGEFMLLCGSCNRAKSWSCEHCNNWTKDRDPTICQTCYWGSPEKYVHIALRAIRRLDVVWDENEVPDYDKLLEMSKHAGDELPEFVKQVLRRHARG